MIYSILKFASDTSMSVEHLLSPRLMAAISLYMIQPSPWILRVKSSSDTLPNFQSGFVFESIHKS